MEALYELVLRDQGEKVVLAEAIDVGDAVAIRLGEGARAEDHPDART
jgi:hypothetical protein